MIRAESADSRLAVWAAVRRRKPWPARSGGRSTGRGCESEDRALLRTLAHGVIVRTEAAQGEDTMQLSQLFRVSLYLLKRRWNGRPLIGYYDVG